MIYLNLFLTFFEIGAVSFGGGYAMIALMRDRALAHGWMSEAEIMNMIAVAESTPGPIAVNMATFVGASEGGILGALLATLGVVLPSFIIILLVAGLFRGLLKSRPFGAFMKGVRPAVVAIILATALTLALSTLFGIKDVFGAPAPDVVGIIIFALVALVPPISKRLFGKKPSPILLILLSAGLGILLYLLKDTALADTAAIGFGFNIF